MNPITPGVSNCVPDAVKITSASTPEPGAGDVFLFLLASAVLLAVSV